VGQFEILGDLSLVLFSWAMTTHFRRLHIKAPQFFHGELMRELSRIGGFIQALTETRPLLTIYAAVPAEEDRKTAE
jgi:hypothetical protein